MGGFFGVVSKNDCISDLFYGTDYHSHLGTRRGGMVVRSETGFTRFIHNISNTQFRSKFEDNLPAMRGNMGLGVISDYEDQPLLIGSPHGQYSIVTVGRVNNVEEIAAQLFRKHRAHFSEMSGNEINPTELIATLITQGKTIEDGIRTVQETVDGSCSMLILNGNSIYAARDRFGRTPVIIGRKHDGSSYAASQETSAFPNLDYEVIRNLGPGEIVRLTSDGIEQVSPPYKEMQICSFLWVYYGYPSSHYEGINVEDVRNRCGAALAANDDVSPDFVAGIPDSGIGHAIGYASKAGIPYRRPFVKYTPTWPRSFMPQEQRVRDLVARMKLIPIKELVQGNRLLFCEDSIVRGTQLKDIIERVFTYGALEVHMRAACPPLIYSCKYLNFSRSKSELDLAARKAIRELDGDREVNLARYADTNSSHHSAMVESIRQRLGLTSLKYQKLDDMIAAIGLPADKLCTYCWNGQEGCCQR